jgi:hypothetical protein
MSAAVGIADRFDRDSIQQAINRDDSASYHDQENKMARIITGKQKE